MRMRIRAGDYIRVQPIGTADNPVEWSASGRVIFRPDHGDDLWLGRIASLKQLDAESFEVVELRRGTACESAANE